MAEGHERLGERGQEGWRVRADERGGEGEKKKGRGGGHGTRHTGCRGEILYEKGFKLKPFWQ